MMKNKNVKIDVEFETDVFTRASAAHLLISTIEYFLYQRNQIPFVFQTFKYMTSKWTPNESDDYANFYIEKQRRLALSTLDGIIELTKGIKEEAKHNDISTARLIFGATPLTPKEIYEIKMPRISKKISHGNQNRSFDNITNNVILSLVTSQDLYKTFSNNLNITNMYLEIETLGEQQSGCDNFYVKEDINLRTKCPTISINLIQKPSKTGDVIADFIIFESDDELKLTEDIKTDTKNFVDDEAFNLMQAWKEAKVFVKGFKDVFVKGRSIWDD